MMKDSQPHTVSAPRPTPGELRALGPEQRRVALEAQAALAEDLYRDDPELSGFDAFGEDDADGDAPPVQAR